MTGHRVTESRGATWLLVALVLLVVLAAFLPSADTAGRAHVDEAFRRALTGFALARGLNGVISVAQGTEVALQPAGVGVNFAPGEILDPINDLIERFSWIMMLATSSLGVQKVLLSMSAWQGLAVALALAGVLVVVSRVVVGARQWAPVLRRIFLFLLLLRFMMPAIAVANDWVYRTFLERDYVEATQTLERAREQIGEINEKVSTEGRETLPDGLVERARSLYQQALESVDIDARLEEYRLASASISEGTIQLVVVFLMQTVVFPLLFLYIALGVSKRLTRQN